MTKFFRVVISDQAKNFLNQIEVKARNKILYNIDKSSYALDSKIFKKVTNELWEFRTRYNNMQYRLLAFWDRREDNTTLVIATHGLIKKSTRLPKHEIEQAMKIRAEYFSRKRLYK